MALEYQHYDKLLMLIKKVGDIAKQYVAMVIIELSGKIGTIKVECRTAKQKEEMWLLFPKLLEICSPYNWLVKASINYYQFNASKLTYKGLTRDYFDNSFHNVEIYKPPHGNGIRITLLFFCAKSMQSLQHSIEIIKLQ